MYYIVDSITKNIARIETPSGDFIDIPISDLPEHAKEGDIIRQVTPKGTSKVHYTIDQEQTAAVKKRVRSKLDKLRSRTKQ